MSYEIPAKNEDDYKVIGLSKKKNKDYWLKEDRFCYIHSIVYNINILVTCLAFNLPIIFIKIELNSYVYVILILINMIINSFGL